MDDVLRTSELPAVAGGALRVVVADDAPDMRLLVRLTLRRAGGFDVVAEAENGEQAVRAVEVHRPDAVVLDLAMPGSDGLSAIPLIRAASPGTKILVMSGFGRSELREEAARLGAGGYLEKGESFERLAGELRRLCGRAHDATAAPEPAEPETVPQEVLWMLAHELSNPVAVIRGFADTLSEHGEDLTTEDRRAYADAIARGAAQLAALISTLTDVRGVDHDMMELVLDETELSETVGTIVGDLDALAPGRVRFETDGAIVGRVDRVRLRQVLSNLVSNAVRFSTPDSPVLVRMSVDADDVVIVVSNEGPPIPPEARGRLFTKFSRLAERPRGGMGLGLYIARGIMRAHGGDLRYEAPGGGGSLFVMTMPGKAIAHGEG